jgi:hypothetical protein
LSLQFGCVLAFRDTEGFLLELQRWNGQRLLDFGLDARVLDDELGWKKHPLTRARVLRLLSKALSKKAISDLPTDGADCGTPAGALPWTKALQDIFLSKR